ncbi:3-keto-5-aminohexanoate cleavage protein [Rhodoligotrophos defluvii]|uniref:3-keto-5-aminohexanoate cleavage protein n=1 Tax=Rhodoligotrophos defluvii TaxID=2561934 RepID=UPI0010C9685B|nr:3-keto-5-aminohexanoate cleavage protein [Rhodoligotrophos defluvii]
MADPKKTIITCAVTGSIHTPSMSPYLPVTPKEIAEQAIEAAQAGAAIVHIHARDPQTGEPASSPALYREIVTRISDGCDAVINITTGGGNNMSVEQRLAAAVELRPEICSLNMGSMNFPMHTLLRKYRAFRYEWERSYIEESRDFVFKSTFKDIEETIALLSPLGTRFEFECYDVGHLYTLAFFEREGSLNAPYAVQFVMGILGGIGASIEELVHMKSAADRLFADRYRFSVLAGGKAQMQIAAAGAAMGGNIRVGLEDSLYIAAGELAKSNAEQVRKAVRILTELSCPIATPEEARRILHLKGRGG